MCVFFWHLMVNGMCLLKKYWKLYSWVNSCGLFCCYLNIVVRQSYTKGTSSDDLLCFGNHFFCSCCELNPPFLSLKQELKVWLEFARVGGHSTQTWREVFLSCRIPHNIYRDVSGTEGKRSLQEVEPRMSIFLNKSLTDSWETEGLQIETLWLCNCTFVLVTGLQMIFQSWKGSCSLPNPFEFEAARCSPTAPHSGWKTYCTKIHTHTHGNARFVWGLSSTRHVTVTLALALTSQF